MKAYIRDTGSEKAPFNGHPIRLTVALIVKDEEKTLDKCLSSLQPLLNAVPSELIITDTGSADSTVEIAKKYTDNILHFEWCGDFSAARNTGVKAARGEWFMFLDGDEWFENTDEIIEFFSSGECDKYGSGSFVVRNYLDPQGKAYEDFHALRLFKFYPGMCFESKVHESIKWMKPLKFFNDYAHHYGYVYATEAEKQEKFDRNIALLKAQLENNPTDLKMYYQIGKQYFTGNHYDKVKEYCEKGLELEKTHPDKTWRLSILHNLLMVYLATGENQKLLDTVDRFFSTAPEDEIMHLDFHYYAQLAAFRLKQYGRAVTEGERYLKVYKKYMAKQLDETMLIFGDFLYANAKSMQKAIATMIWSCLLQNDAKQDETAVSLLQQFDLSQPFNKDIHDVWFAAADHTGKWELIAVFYRKILALGKNENRLKFISCTETYISQNQSKSLDIIHALSILENEDDYVYLNRLRYAEATGNREEALKALDWFAQNENDWSDRLTDVLFFAMKEKINIMPYLLKIDTDDLKYFVAGFKNFHPDFADISLEYFKTYSFENLKGLYWTIILKEKIIFAKTDLSDEEYLDFFEGYARETACYVRLVFRGEMFSSANIAALPRAYRFGYYMGAAFDAEKKSNNADRVMYLRLALKAYPVMDKPIGMMLDKIQKGSSEKAAKAAEFAALAVKVKAQIESLITRGDLKQAGQITAQLAQLLPNDKDIIRYRKLTNTVPTMAELAAHLPQ